MKQTSLWAALLAALLLGGGLASCQHGDTDGTAAADSTASATALPAADLRATRTQGGVTYTLLADYPMGGNALLLRSVREWMNECLGGSYAGSLADTTALADHYVQRALAAAKEGGGTDEELAASHWEEESEFRRVYEDDSLITYAHKLYLYMGGAHGSSAYVGMTFRKSDGHRFGWNMMMHKGPMLNDVLKAGLKAYFKVTTDAELNDQLLLAETWRDASALPQPNTEPWLEGDGLHFIYQQYEIAPYAAGMPAVVVPLDEARKLLNTTVLPCLPQAPAKGHGQETSFLRRVLHNLHGGCSSCSHG